MPLSGASEQPLSIISQQPIERLAPAVSKKQASVKEKLDDINKRISVLRGKVLSLSAPISPTACLTSNQKKILQKNFAVGAEKLYEKRKELRSIGDNVSHQVEKLTKKNSQLDSQIQKKQKDTAKKVQEKQKEIAKISSSKKIDPTKLKSLNDKVTQLTLKSEKDIEELNTKKKSNLNAIAGKIDRLSGQIDKLEIDIEAHSGAFKTKIDQLGKLNDVAKNAKDFITKSKKDFAELRKSFEAGNPGKIGQYNQNMAELAAKEADFHRLEEQISQGFVESNGKKIPLENSSEFSKAVNFEIGRHYDAAKDIVNDLAKLTGSSNEKDWDSLRKDSGAGDAGKKTRMAEVVQRFLPNKGSSTVATPKPPLTPQSQLQASTPNVKPFQTQRSDALQGAAPSKVESAKSEAAKMEQRKTELLTKFAKICAEEERIFKVADFAADFDVDSYEKMEKEHRNIREELVELGVVNPRTDKVFKEVREQQLKTNALLGKLGRLEAEMPNIKDKEMMQRYMGARDFARASLESLGIKPEENTIYMKAFQQFGANAPTTRFRTLDESDLSPPATPSPPQEPAKQSPISPTPQPEPKLASPSEPSPSSPSTQLNPKEEAVLSSPSEKPAHDQEVLQQDALSSPLAKNEEPPGLQQPEANPASPSGPSPSPSPSTEKPVIAEARIRGESLVKEKEASKAFWVTVDSMSKKPMTKSVKEGLRQAMGKELQKLLNRTDQFGMIDRDDLAHIDIMMRNQDFVSQLQTEPEYQELRKAIGKQFDNYVNLLEAYRSNEAAAPKDTQDKQQAAKALSSISAGALRSTMLSLAKLVTKEKGKAEKMLEKCIPLLSDLQNRQYEEDMERIAVSSGEVQASPTGDNVKRLGLVSRELLDTEESFRVTIEGFSLLAKARPDIGDKLNLLVGRARVIGDLSERIIERYKKLPKDPSSGIPTEASLSELLSSPLWKSYTKQIAEYAAVYNKEISKLSELQGNLTFLQLCSESRKNETPQEKSEREKVLAQIPKNLEGFVPSSLAIPIVQRLPRWKMLLEEIQKSYGSKGSTYVKLVKTSGELVNEKTRLREMN